MSLVERLGAWSCVKHEDHWEAALSAAIEVNDSTIVARLLSDGLKEPQQLGLQLMEAIHENQTPVALMLLTAGAPVHGHDLAAALKQQNKQVVNIILESDVDVVENAHNKMAMELAGLWGDVSVVEDLIYMGFDLNIGLDTTALAAAVKSGDLNLVDLLFTHGADPSAAAQSEKSSLYEAVHKADEKMIQYLLSKGANPADTDAFLEAIRQHRGSLDTLLEAFANRYPHGCKGFGPDVLIEAIKINDQNLLKTLLKGQMNINSLAKKYYLTPLGAAIQCRGGKNITSVRRLLDAGARVNSIVAAPLGRGGGKSQVWPQGTAVLVAIGTRNEKMIKFILKNGGDVNQAARRGVKRTPLQKACELGSFNIVKLLLDSGADVNGPPAIRGGGTALQLASGTGSISIVQLLLAYGADIHAPTSDINGRSALEAAAETGCLDLLKILWDASYGVGFSDNEVQRAVSLAKKRGHGWCEEYMAELRASSDRALSQAAALIDFPL